MHQAPGTREAEVAKAILPIDFCSHRKCRIVAIETLAQQVVPLPSEPFRSEVA